MLTPFLIAMDLTTIITIGVCVVGLLIVIGMLVGIYNKLVMLRNRMKNAFAQIEVQLKRRYDLIPNLVETAKGYMKHESETLENVIQARNQAHGALQAMAGGAPGNPAMIAELQNAEGMLAGAMSKLNVVMEAYPDLKANENMMQVSEELTSTENKISFARQAYNDSVTTYNTARESFPAVVFAGMFGHGQSAAHLEFEEGQKLQEAPKITF